MGPRRDRRPTTDGCRYSWCACGDTVALCPLFRGKTIHCQPRRPRPVPREAAAAVTVDRETRTVTMGHDVPRSRRRGGKRAARLDHETSHSCQLGSLQEALQVYSLTG